VVFIAVRNLFCLEYTAEAVRRRSWLTLPEVCGSQPWATPVVVILSLSGVQLTVHGTGWCGMNSWVDSSSQHSQHLTGPIGTGGDQGRWHRLLASQVVVHVPALSRPLTASPAGRSHSTADYCISVSYHYTIAVTGVAI
jgi:hypothetical protein